jgi:hypothetical protein
MLSPPEITDDSGDEIARCTENECFAATHEEPGDRPEGDTH